MEKISYASIFSNFYRTPSGDLFNELQWLSFSDRCKYHSSVLIYKTLNYTAPSYMSEVVSFSQNSVYNLRSIENNDLVLQHRYNTRYMKTSFASYSKLIWNTLPLSVRNSSN